jgi:hypothetical protein
LNSHSSESFALSEEIPTIKDFSYKLFHRFPICNFVAKTHFFLMEFCCR